VTLEPDAVSPFDEPRLRCRRCGARNPKVQEVEVRQPFEDGYGANGVTSVTVLDTRRKKPGTKPG
jgi:hypothetical protein